MSDLLGPADLAAIKALAGKFDHTGSLGTIPARSLAAQGLATIEADHGGSVCWTALTDAGRRALARHEAYGRAADVIGVPR